MRWLALVVVLSGCRQILGIEDGVIDDGMPPGPDASGDALRVDGAPGAARKRRVTIDPNRVFGDLTSFPIWFVYDDPMGLGAKSSLAGDDIYFTRPDGTPLEFELVRWDKPTGHLEAWVRVDLADLAPTDIDLRFGDPGPAHLSDSVATFSSGFLSVWHMDTIQPATQVPDARGIATGMAFNSPTLVAGKLGGAIGFNGIDTEVRFMNPLAGSGSHTISAWVSLASPVSGFSSVMTIGSATTNRSRFFVTKSPGLTAGFFGNDMMTNVDVHNSQFTLLHWVYDGASRVSTLYRDGLQVSTSTATPGVNTLGTTGYIGNAPPQWGPGGNTPNPTDGLIDEVRLSNVARPVGWVRTEHANQSDPGTFFTVGPELPAQ